MQTVNYSDFSGSLENHLDNMIANHDTLFVPRGNGKESIVVMSFSEYNSFKATLHLLSNPKNSTRLLEATERTEKGHFEKHDLMD